VHLLNRKDIANIEKSFHINSVSHPNDDATSVHYWVNEVMGTEHNPVIFYKPQGSPQHQDWDNLANDDFVLCLQTPLQATLMKELCHNRVLCIDSTHGTNMYNFQLITVVVADELGEGIPVAWCLSNREDLFVLIHFFVALKKKIGEVIPK
jgi:hypothetical protein